MKCSELNKYCFYILLTVALSTFLINLISNPGEYIAKLKTFEHIEYVTERRINNNETYINKTKLDGKIDVTTGVGLFRIQNY